jgi:hypothetical protein
VRSQTKTVLRACLLYACVASAAATVPPRTVAPAKIGPLPTAALRLPRDSRVLMGLSVRSFAASPFYARFAQPGAALRPTALDELKRLTGLDGERDLDELVVATGQPGEIVILATGRLDRPRLDAAWAGRPQKTPAQALAFLSERTLAIGNAPWVDVVTGKAKAANLRANAALLALVRQVPERATFWMVGDSEALARLAASNAKAPAAAGLPLGLPPLKSIVIAGDLDPLVSVTVTAEALDAKAAGGLADMLRGFLALAALQAQSKPALRDLPQAVEVTQQGTRVSATARLTYEMLDALISRHTPTLPQPSPKQ